MNLYVSACLHAPVVALTEECGRRQWQLDSPVLCRCVSKRSETSKPGSSFKTELRTYDSYIIFV